MGSGFLAQDLKYILKQAKTLQYALWQDSSPRIHSVSVKFVRDKFWLSFGAEGVEDVAPLLELRLHPEVGRILKELQSLERLSDNKLRDSGLKVLKRIQHRKNIRIGKLKKVVSPDLDMLSRIKSDRQEEKTGKKNNIAPKLLNSGRSLFCNEGDFSFTPRQGKVMSEYFENYLDGNEYLAEDLVFDRIKKQNNSNDQKDKLIFSNLRETFKSRSETFNLIFQRHPKEPDLWRLDLG